MFILISRFAVIDTRINILGTFRCVTYSSDWRPLPEILTGCNFLGLQLVTINTCTVHMYMHAHVLLLLQMVLDISRDLLDEIEQGSDDEHEVEEKVHKLKQLKTVLEMYGTFSGINRKVQLKLITRRQGEPCEWAKSLCVGLCLCLSLSPSLPLSLSLSLSLSFSFSLSPSSLPPPSRIPIAPHQLKDILMTLFLQYLFPSFTRSCLTTHPEVGWWTHPGREEASWGVWADVSLHIPGRRGRVLVSARVWVSAPPQHV